MTRQAAFWDIPEYYDLTLKEFDIAIRAKLEKREYEERGEWERARWITANLLQPHSKKPISLKKLITFPWERTEFEDLKERLDSTKHLFKDKLDG